MAQTLPIDALRLHLAERSPHSAGELFAPADKQMRAVISAMHAEPARRWTLADRAGVGGMLRSSFAVGFKETVGEPAMDYLTRWRMLVTADRLASGRGGRPAAGSDAPNRPLLGTRNLAGNGREWATADRQLCGGGDPFRSLGAASTLAKSGLLSILIHSPLLPFLQIE